MTALSTPPELTLASSPSETTLTGSMTALTVRIPSAGAPEAPSHDTPLNLSYRWLDGEGRVVIADGLRTPFARGAHVAATERRMLVQAPDHAGRFTLQVSAVYEGAFWWIDRGYPPLSATFDVKEPDQVPLLLVAGGAGRPQL